MWTKEVSIDYAKKAFLVIALLAVGYAAYNLFGGVSDNGARIQQVTGELNSIRQDNRNIRAELQHVSETVNRSRNEVGESRTTVVTVRERIEADGQSAQEARRINNESKSILDTIQQRAKGNTK